MTAKLADVLDTRLLDGVHSSGVAQAVRVSLVLSQSCQSGVFGEAMIGILRCQCGTKQEEAGNWTFVFLGANLDAFTQGTSLGVRVANSVRYDSANYRGVYASLAQNTNMFSADAARATGDFFKGEAAGIKKSSRVWLNMNSWRGTQSCLWLSAVSCCAETHVRRQRRATD